MAILVGIIAIFTSYHGLANHQVKKHDERIPRDPQTGIIEGGAPEWLGPEDSKTAVLFVHGFLGVGNNFSELPERMAKKGHRVRVMLLPGHGTSPIDFKNTPREDFLKAVLEEVHQLKENHEQVFMISHSMGGALTTLVYVFIESGTYYPLS